MGICLFPTHSNISNRVLPETMYLVFVIRQKTNLSIIFFVTNHCRHFMAKIVDFHLSDQSFDQIELFCFKICKKSEINGPSFWIGGSESRVKMKIQQIWKASYMKLISSLFEPSEKGGSLYNLWVTTSHT